MNPNKLEDDSVYTGTEVKALIEKLIADIPDNVWADDGSQTVKQQLRLTWL
jgi:hypothetical protein